jgi:hypothetical protein
MALFKSLRAKSKEYAFKFGGNENLKHPAKAVFARFPLPDENFLKPGNDIRYSDVDWKKLGEKDTKEVEKLFQAFAVNFINESVGASQFSKVDYHAFLRECVEGFDNLFVEQKPGEKSEIKSVDDFLSLPEAAVYEITQDLYSYAREKEDFTMGESKA